jgi:hypothetical protein
MTPADPHSGATADEPAATPMEYRWYHKTGAVLFIVFCLEIGCFLLIFPWTEYWEWNFLGSLIPRAHLFWDSSYVRGAVSGLGLVNLYIAFVEIIRLRRFARH